MSRLALDVSKSITETGGATPPIRQATPRQMRSGTVIGTRAPFGFGRQSSMAKGNRIPLPAHGPGLPIGPAEVRPTTTRAAAIAQVLSARTVGFRRQPDLEHAPGTAVSTTGSTRAAAQKVFRAPRSNLHLDRPDSGPAEPRHFCSANETIAELRKQLCHMPPTSSRL